MLLLRTDKLPEGSKYLFELNLGNHLKTGQRGLTQDARTRTVQDGILAILDLLETITWHWLV